MAKGKKSKVDRLAREVRRREQTRTTRPTQSSALPRSGPAGMVTSSLDERLATASHVDAWQFLLNYLNYVRDGGFDVPMDKFGPQRPGETADEAELRLRAARLEKEVQALAGNWAELCAEVLDRPTLALNPEVMVAHVVGVGRNWLKTAGHVPNRDEWLAGTRPLLGVLCGPEYWLDALNVLDQVGTMGIEPDEDAPLVPAAVQAKPAAALHAASALVTWLYCQRSVVFDQTAAMRTLARKTHAMAESLETA